MGGLVAAAAQQVEELAHLGVHAQAGIDGAQQLGLGGLDQVHTQPGGNVLRDGLGQQAQFEHAAGGVERKQALCRGAQFCQ